MNYIAGIWLTLLIVCLWVEAETVAVVSLWFSFGALAAMITALCNGALWLQVTLFLGVSTVFLALLRPITKRYLTPKLTKTNVDAVAGSEGVVLETVDNELYCGRVKLGALEWTARSTTGEVLEKGTHIVADRVEGVKVFVSPVKTPVK